MNDQKHYPMPAITEQEREELTSFATSMINLGGHDDTGTNDLLWLSMKIALAALTAEPAGFHRADALSVFRVWPDKDDFINVPVYRSPPVPALNPIALPEMGFKAKITEIEGRQVPCMTMVKGGNYLHRCRVRGILEDLGFEVKDAE